MPDMSDLDRILREAYQPMIEEHLRSTSLIVRDGWPRQWVLFPRLWKIEYTTRWAWRDIKYWWQCRPTFLGGDGPDE